MTPETATHLVFLFDVDNTLIDNDSVKADLEARIADLVGAETAAVFWRVYEEVRNEFDYVDLPHTLERLHAALPDEPSYARLAEMVLCYPFNRSLFEGALAVVEHCATMGTVGVLTDGDPVYQPAKIARAGIADAVAGNVLVFAHKEEHVEDIRRRMPATHWVLVDDKLRILALMKDRMGDSLTTVHVCQGGYANLDGQQGYPRADISVEAISELLGFGSDSFGAVASAAPDETKGGS